MNDPRYVILVMLDEPKGTKETQGYATGGWVAAPAVKTIVENGRGAMPGGLVSGEDLDNVAAYVVSLQ